MISKVLQTAALSLSVLLSSAPALAQQAIPQPNVVVIATGGTIAQTDSKEAKLLVDQLIDAVPQIRSVAKVSAEQLFQVSSPDITVENWLTLAKRINQLLARDDVQGVVVTHGTDTMEETAYFLDLVVKSSKPVVLVGSMRGSKSPGADGPANLLNAVIVASSADAKAKGVLVTLNDRILAARDVTKTNTFTLDTFASPDFGSLGYIQAGRARFYREPIRKHTIGTEFDVAALSSLPKVSIVYSFVGVEPPSLTDTVNAKVKGVVYAGTGNGSVPKAMQPAALGLVKAGIPFVRAARVNGGIVERNGEHNDDQMGFVTADSLNPQKARILLMLALTKTTDAQVIQRIFETY
ncbi:asparaginase [Variovorax sp. R-27]|jgi:L-asparaginase type II|uniref:asparaginase n=1 Tax=Variovorax sp. R-27 TaxID=3404058 RepID=UPI003CFA9514